MLKKDKERLVEELTDRLRSTQTLIVADYRGLTMSEIDGLRGELLKHGARFSVVKNTLTRRAAEEAGAQQLLALLEGPTAIAFLESEGDPVAVAKAINDAARTTRVLVEGIARARVSRYIPSGNVLRAAVSPFPFEGPNADDAAAAAPFGFSERFTSQRMEPWSMRASDTPRPLTMSRSDPPPMAGRMWRVASAGTRWMRPSDS